ncbi:TonB-dependent receptor plug domain-containing protein [Neisseria viridiae]|uniref:TonB-dependent receptor plug domain-containing protein n=1 Tax=Neisseria viridiae TaxID=2830648 RepID=UPI00265A0F47|nr:TonB-dependent receptor plug domain-containing protein [Neisseria viridiae]
MTSAELPQVNVNAHKDKSSRDLQAKDVLGDGDVLTAHDLKTKRAVSLGQTLEKVGGVQNAGFGPNTGLPQIRSLSGSRVYISENGMGVSDMAAISGNLPTMVNPFLADKITVLKSSAAVLYGGNAIGGAVDVDTGIIPHKLPEQDFGGKIELSGGYNTPHNEAFRFDGKTGNFAWHLDASNSQISGYRIPGSSKPDLCYDPANRLNSRLMWSCQITPEIEEKLNYGYFKYKLKDSASFFKKYPDADESEAYKLVKPMWGEWIDNPLYDGSKEFRKTTVHAMRDDTPVREGRLGNSSLKNRSVSFGGSYIGERGHIGAAVSRSLYRSGIPGFSYYNIDGNGNRKLAAEPASVYSQQTRWLVDALYRPQSSWVDNVSFLTSYTDTPNTELLGSTKVNSLDSRTLQNRIELNHHFSSLFNGSIGADYKRRHTESSGLNGKRTGNYSYLPDTNSREYGIFVLENLKYRNYEASLGWRYGNVRHGLDLGSYKTARNTGSKKGSEQRSSLKYSLNSFHRQPVGNPFRFGK